MKRRSNEDQLATVLRGLYYNDVQGYGVFGRRRKKTGGKDVRTVHREPTASDWRDHAAGRRIIGMHTLSPSSTSRWGAYDFDVARAPDGGWLPVVVKLLETLRNHGLDAHLEHASPGESFHLWVHLDQAAPTPRLRYVLRYFAPPDAEIFPKQDRLTNGSRLGNFLRLPGPHPYDDFESRFYDAGAWVPWRTYILGVQGGPLVDVANDVDTGQSQQGVCNPTSVSFGPGERNTTLTSFAGRIRQCGASQGEIATKLCELNKVWCTPPLDEDEVHAIAASIGSRAVQPSFTDLGNARLLVAEHGEDLRFVKDWRGAEHSGWMHWTGRSWEHDRTGQPERYAKDVATKIVLRAASNPELSDENRKQLVQHGLRSQNIGRMRAMVESASTEPELACTSDAFDTHLWKLNVANGTIDLKTGALSKHRRDDLLTKCLDTPYDPAAGAGRWERFITEITCGRDNLARYLQQAVGLSLVGAVREHAMFFLVGNGANGKSTFLEVLRALFGPYGAQTNLATFMEGNQGKIREDIARLRGKRLVTGVEASATQRLDAVLIKRLTGGDTQAERMLYNATQEWAPQLTCWIGTNETPQVDAGDDALFRRVKVVPFDAQFDPDQQDRGLKEALMRELPGILAWGVRGYFAWKELGFLLDEPIEVLEATRAYRADADFFGEFIDEHVIREDGEKLFRDDIYAVFRMWRTTRGVKAVESIEWFTRQMNKTLGTQTFKRGTNGQHKHWVNTRKRRANDQPEF